MYTSPIPFENVNMNIFCAVGKVVQFDFFVDVSMYLCIIFNKSF